MSVYHLCTMCLQMPEEGIDILDLLVSWVLGTELRATEEQLGLLITEWSLQFNSSFVALFFILKQISLFQNYIIAWKIQILKFILRVRKKVSSYKRIYSNSLPREHLYYLSFQLNVVFKTEETSVLEFDWEKWFSLTLPILVQANLMKCSGRHVDTKRYESR